MEELQYFLSAFKGITDIDDEILTDEAMKTLLDGVDQNFSKETVNQAINQMIQNLDAQGLNREEAAAAAESLKSALKEMVYGDNVYTGNKQILVETLLQKTFDIFDAAIEKYHSFSIELPMTVDAGAKVPTYAHDTDAAADLYALEDQTIAARSYGNKIRTGVKIQLPEGWLAFIMPRSSIGVKTPLRLSNSVGLIDSGYRGELGILYDNTSDEDYQISAGDRIAQLLVMPSYRFKAKVVDILADSDRGEGGFGASGK